MSLSAGSGSDKERRIHQRFRVKDETLAFFGKDTGTIVDIGKGGLAVQMAVFEQELSIPPQVDIFLAHSRFYLRNLPVTLVGEVQTLPHSLFSSLRIKRLCMKFGPLTGEQQARIDDFIRKNTVAFN